MMSLRGWSEQARAVRAPAALGWSGLAQMAEHRVGRSAVPRCHPRSREGQAADAGGSVSQGKGDHPVSRPCLGAMLPALPGLSFPQWGGPCVHARFAPMCCYLLPLAVI